MKNGVFLALWLVLGVAFSMSAQAHPLVFGDADGGKRPNDVTEVLERLDRIADYLKDDASGVGAFNHLYFGTTANLEKAVAAGRFEDGEFMRRFAVRFAEFYFDAVSAYYSPRVPTPGAWLPLLKRNGRSEFRRVQFAAAGMQAHICRDLPIVLSELFAGERFPERDSARYRDFERFNDVIAATFDEQHDELMDGPLWVTILGDETALPLIQALRTKAWVDAKSLWSLRRRPIARTLLVQGLDAWVRAQVEATFALRF